MFQCMVLPTCLYSSPASMQAAIELKFCRDNLPDKFQEMDKKFFNATIIDNRQIQFF